MNDIVTSHGVTIELTTTLDGHAWLANVKRPTDSRSAGRSNGDA